MRTALGRRWARWIVGAVALLTVSQSVVAAPGAAAPEGDAAWTALHDGPQRFPSIHIDWDVPITMSDGTVLKANVYRPADANGPIDTPFPTIVNMTPYTKLGSMILQTALSVPVLSDAVVGLLRDFELPGTPLEGLTDATRVAGGGLGRVLSVEPNQISNGYTQIVVDVRGSGLSQCSRGPRG
ncbi:CocE/NonD family hydrolase, partial [Nocardia brasiliensis]|uniref:CocE/NonD family hydrolase n=1 Tax=Nocardia brasiliensis TaxID=37326 RepID=UPI0024560000